MFESKGECEYPAYILPFKHVAHVACKHVAHVLHVAQVLRSNATECMPAAGLTNLLALKIRSRKRVKTLSAPHSVPWRIDRVLRAQSTVVAERLRSKAARAAALRPTSSPRELALPAGRERPLLSVADDVARPR